MKMQRTTTLGVLVALLALSAPIVAQSSQYGDYEWARALSREFGFDEMASAIFNDMAKGPGHSSTEKQQGLLGLAEMKQRQARKAKTIEQQLELFDEARKLMQEVVKNWPEKSTPEYYKAVFVLADLLRERGEVAVKAITGGNIPKKDAEAIRKDAMNDYDRGFSLLERVKMQMGTPDPSVNREKWRIKNNAWYSQALLKYNRATAAKKNSAEYHLGLSQTSELLEEYILENETDDEEAYVGALYGYLILGQVKGKLGEDTEAIGNFTSVLDVVEWDTIDTDPSYRLHPVVQSLSEKAYFNLLSFLNEQQRYEDTKRYGTEMEQRFKKLDAQFKKYGRAARVKLAEAQLRTGDMSNALSIAAQVVETAGGDESGTLANRLVAEIIAATPDKKQFSPEILRSAAKGAYSQGGVNRDDAIRYFQLFLQVSDKIEDPEERKYLEADAYYYMGRSYYFRDRHLEAGLVLGEGTRKYKDVTRDELASSMGGMWRSTLRGLAQETKSPAIEKLYGDCTTWLINNPTVAEVPAGTLAYNKALKIERQATAAAKRKQTGPALKLYEDAAKEFKRSIQLGGPKKERAMIKVARIDLLISAAQGDAGQAGQAMSRARSAKQGFLDYMKYADDPANKLTDPAAISGREAARAEAAYSVSRANRRLMSGDTESANAKKLLQESLQFLNGYESKYADQKGLVIAAVYDRLNAHLALGDLQAAEADYKVLKGMDPGAVRTKAGAAKVAKALLPDAEKAFTAVVGEASSSVPSEWEAATAKPGFAAAQARMLEVLGYYRDWVTGGGGSKKLSDWDYVTYKYHAVGAWDDSVDLHRKALERFEGSAKADEAKIVGIKYRLLVADVRLARQAEVAGRDDDAGRLWSESGRMLESVMANPRYSRSPVTVRIAAIVNGGYITLKDGLPRYYSGLGRFDKALDHWKMILGSLKAGDKTGTDDWWEAQFYIYHSAFQKTRKNKGDLRSLGKKLDAFRAAYPEFGGKNWNRFFLWLDSKL